MTEPRYTPDQMREAARQITLFTPDDTDTIAMLRQGADAMEAVAKLRQELVELQLTLDDVEEAHL